MTAPSKVGKATTGAPQSVRITSSTTERVQPLAASGKAVSSAVAAALASGASPAAAASTCAAASGYAQVAQYSVPAASLEPGAWYVFEMTVSRTALKSSSPVTYERLCFS